MRSVNFLWPPYVMGQAICISSCRFFFFFFFFLSSPNLSHRRLDVYHTHGMALVRIWNAGLKRAARGSLEMPDAKDRQKVAICSPSYNFVGLCLRN